MATKRNRVIYAGTTVLMSDYPCWYNQTGQYSLKLLNRITNSALSINSPVTRAKQIGSSEFAFERYISPPEVKVDLDYYLTDNSNELIFGFNATGNEGILKDLASAQRDRNIFFLLTDTNSQDADSVINTTGLDIFSVGNAFVNSYSISAEVGNVPKGRISFSALNMMFQSYSGFQSDQSNPSAPVLITGVNVPAINLTNGKKALTCYSLETGNLSTSNYLTNQNSKATALRNGDIVLQLQQPVMGGIRYTGEVPASISSLSIDIPITRKDLVGFGSNYPYDKRLMFPVIGTISFNGTFDQQINGDFSNIFDDENSYDFSFLFKDCNGNTSLKIDVLQAKVESQSFELSIDNNMTFSSSFSFKISENDGFRMSGAARLTDSLIAATGAAD